jgi:hypothetical protein
MVLWAPHAVTMAGLRPVVNATTSSPQDLGGLRTGQDRQATRHGVWRDRERGVGERSEEIR